MKCSECGTDNPSGLRFCRDCGTKLPPRRATPGAGPNPTAVGSPGPAAGGASFIVYKVRTACNECGEAVMFDGPVLSMPCPACQSPVDVDAERWKSILGFREDLARRRLVEGQIRNSTNIAGSGTFSVGWGPQRPVCGGCGALLDLHAAPPGTDGAIACAACGASTTTAPPPEWLVAVVPEVLQIFGARRPVESAGGAAVEAPVARRPVSFACPECGGNLRITGESPRVLECSYCNADLYLPDPLWRALHPVKKRIPWIVAFRR